MKRSLLFLLAVTQFFAQSLYAQPSAVPEGIRFVYDDQSASSVSLVGDFNCWSAISHPMSRTGTGQWTTTISLLPGTYQYAFLVDKERIQRDPNTPLSFEAIDGSSINSMLTVSPTRKLVTEGYPVRRDLNDVYEKKGGTVYLNLVFKHHLPLYYNAKKDRIDAPFVRTHATRDYFQLADIIQRYSNVHATTVLSPTLLWQIQEIYVNRLQPFIKSTKASRRKPADMDANGFLARMKGKTDPWIDICLTPAERLTEEDKAHLYKNEWNAFTMSPVRLHRFPELLKLYETWKDAKGNPTYTTQELRTLKFFAIFGHFDTEFYERSVPLIQTGTRIKLALDLRDLVSFRSDGKYYLKKEITEDHCRRIVASAYYIMSSILPNFQKVKYNRLAKIGQMEMAASSFSDAVLPLIINSDVAKTADPTISLPPAYAHPEDAITQLQMSQTAYRKYLDYEPVGYVPPYGAISPAVIPVLKENGFEWFTSDEAVLNKCQPSELPVYAPYKVTVNGSTLNGIFSENLLSNRINWVYRNYYAENSAHDFIENLLAMAPKDEKKDVLVTVVLDNDDAWMHYQRDTDGKGFINSIYRKINKLFDSRAIVSVTMSEYISGNRDRGIPPHNPADFKSISTLAAGSRFDGNFNVWIGAKECNTAWGYIKNVREELGKVAQPDTSIGYLDNFAKIPFNLFYGATSPHWLRTFSPNIIMRINPKPYERTFLAMLHESSEKAGINTSELKSFVPADAHVYEWEKPKKLTRVTFLCKLVDREAITAVFIAGNRKELGNMETNTIRMWDNGEYGDERFGDNLWTLVVELEAGDLLYKYSNSGGQGTWEGSEAFPDIWRKVRIEGEKMTINDIFAKFKPTN